MDNIVSSYKEMWQRWNDFSGRSGVGKYWWVVLANFILYVAVIIVALIFRSNAVLTFLRIVVSIYGFAILVPGLALGIRRLHDTDRSGWWILLAFVPIVGQVAVIVFFASTGTPGPNRYGLPDTYVAR